MGSKTVKTETVEGYRLFDMGILSKLVGDLLCPDCCQLYVSTDISQRKGLPSYVSIKCTCGYTRSEYTSPIIQGLASYVSIKCTCGYTRSEYTSPLYRSRETE